MSAAPIPPLPPLPAAAGVGASADEGAAVQALREIGRIGIFAGALAARLFRRPFFWSEALYHLWTTTLRCLLPVVAVTLPFGMVIALQGLEIFRMFGAERLLSSLVSVAVLRELSPVLASVLVAAQGGSSTAAELGSMRIKEEIDATEVMAVDGLQYLVLPRFLGLMLATPLLNIAGNVAGLVGGYVMAVWIEGEPGGIFLGNLWALTAPMDVWAGLLKTLVFGAVIGLVACYQGYNTTGGAAGVGRAVNDTVVQAVLVFIVANYFLTSALFGGMGP